MSFQDQNLHQGILKAISDAGYTTPTPIQEMVIPKILSGLDIRASAQTGTGKTAAFLLPALQRLTAPSPIKGSGPRILVLVPTRELAMQVANEAVKYSKYLSKAKTVCIYGGAPYPIQNRQLSRPYEILVATPGRLIDHLERGKIDFSRLEMLILDEADRMLDMGFIGPVEQIAEATPEDRQTLMFSATLKGSVMNLSKKLLKDPIEIEAEHSQTHIDNIEQRLHQVDNLSHKNNLLEHLLIDPSMNQTIIFTSTKRHAEEMVGMLHEMGHSTAALHGDMNQRQRTRTILRLRQQEIKVLVATDVAARGIDVQTISHVINFDMPMGVEDYVHRIGRTGRAGAKGVAISFASPKDMQQVRRIEQFTGQKMAIHVIPGFEPQTKEKKSDGKRSDGRRQRGDRGSSRGRERGRGDGSFSNKVEREERAPREQKEFRVVDRDEPIQKERVERKERSARSFDKPKFSSEKSAFKSKEDKPFRTREDKPFRSKEKSFGSREDKPFRSKEKSFEPKEGRPFKSKESSFENNEDKPFKSKERSFGSREDKPFRSKERSFGSREDKPFRSREKSFETREDKPFRSKKPSFEAREDKPFRPKERPFGSREDKPFKSKERSFGSREDKPFRSKESSFEPREGKPFRSKERSFEPRERKSFGSKDNRSSDKPGRGFGSKPSFASKGPRSKDRRDS